MYIFYSFRVYFIHRNRSYVSSANWIITDKRSIDRSQIALKYSFRDEHKYIYPYSYQANTLINDLYLERLTYW